MTSPAGKSMVESDVGICCYISKLPGFRGILKQRYSDFIVNEVGLEGSVVHLTSLEAPAELAEEKEVTVSNLPKATYNDEIDSFRELAGEDNAGVLKAFLDHFCSGAEVDAEPILLNPSSDKSYRTAVHNFFKERLKFLVTDTVDGPDTSSKCIRVRLNVGKNQRGYSSKKRKDRDDKPYDSRGSSNWPESLGKFLRFHLYKENKETQEAIGLIGKMLAIQPRSFGFAGTKDKRGISTQRVTVYKQRASRLAALNKRLIGIKVGDFCHVNEGLTLGQLKGNRFTVTLRGVVAESEEIIKASASALGELGFINYFGLQRFGTSSVPTHRIGAALLRGEWKNAMDLILDPREGERDDINVLREHYKETGDIDGTLRQLPRHLVAERAILQCLKRSPENYLQALKAIPRTLRMMYVHSYQSYIWNHAASMRVQKYGIDCVLLGDLVYCKEQSKEKETEVNYSEREGLNDSDDLELINEISEIDLPIEKDTAVKALTEEDLVSGTYTIHDIILPLPGSRVTYPVNDIGDYYHDLSSKDDINLTESVHNVKEFSITNMTGGYRQVFQKPKDYEWELLSYRDGSIALAETDMDLIAKSRQAGEHSLNGDKSLVNGEPRPGEAERAVTDNKDAGGVEQTKISDTQEVQRALKLSFTLPTSCYATMAIRELLKTSTSVAYHKTLNQ